MKGEGREGRGGGDYKEPKRIKWSPTGRGVR